MGVACVNKIYGVVISKPLIMFFVRLNVFRCVVFGFVGVFGGWGTCGVFMGGCLPTFSARVLASRASCSQTRARSKAPSLSTFIACIFFLMASMVLVLFLHYCTRKKLKSKWKSKDMKMEVLQTEIETLVMCIQ